MNLLLCIFWSKLRDCCVTLRVNEFHRSKYIFKCRNCACCFGDIILLKVTMKKKNGIFILEQKRRTRFELMIIESHLYGVKSTPGEFMDDENSIIQQEKLIFFYILRNRNTA